jgi:hypothetical protein
MHGGKHYLYNKLGEYLCCVDSNKQAEQVVHLLVALCLSDDAVGCAGQVMLANDMYSASRLSFLLDRDDKVVIISDYCGHVIEFGMSADGNVCVHSSTTYKKPSELPDDFLSMLIKYYEDDLLDQEPAEYIRTFMKLTGDKKNRFGFKLYGDAYDASAFLRVYYDYFFETDVIKFSKNFPCR